MFKIVLFTGLILLVVAMVILLLLKKYKKINIKIFMIVLTILILAIFVGCFATNVLITKEVSLSSNWKAVMISENTTYSDKIDIFLKEEKGKKIIEKKDDTFYFYLDENNELLNSLYDTFDYVSFEMNNEMGYLIKKAVKNYSYEFVGDYWFLSKSDTSVIEKIKSNIIKENTNSSVTFVSERHPFTQKTTELVFFVPKDTLIKMDDINGNDIFKTIDELNFAWKTNRTVITTNRTNG